MRSLLLGFLLAFSGFAHPAAGVTSPWSFDTAVFSETYTSVKGYTDGFGGSAWILKQKDVNDVTVLSRVLWLNKLGQVIQTESFAQGVSVDLLSVEKSRLAVQLKASGTNLLRVYSPVGSRDITLSSGENMVNSRQFGHDRRGLFSVIQDRYIIRYNF